MQTAADMQRYCWLKDISPQHRMPVNISDTAKAVMSDRKTHQPVMEWLTQSQMSFSITLPGESVHLR